MALDCIHLLLFSWTLFYVFEQSLLLDEDVKWDGGEIMDDYKSCKMYLEKFANATSNFTKCAIAHARPIKMCEKCINDYLYVLYAHEEILKAKDESGHSCKMDFVNLDRLEVIEGAFIYVFNLWQRAHCNNCFVMDSNGTLTTELSKSTIKFQELYNETKECIAMFYNGTSETYMTGVCKNCSDKYCSLNKYYEELKDAVDEGILCMDIVDTMNSTRIKWSKKLGCLSSALKAEVSLIISVILILTTPIVFYSAAKRFSVKAPNRLLRQKRLGLQFNCPSTSGS